MLSRLCKSPCSINVILAGETSKEAQQAGIGKQMDVFVQIELADWLPADLLEENNVTLEFCCARKDGTDAEHKKDYIWCGQIRKSLASLNGQRESNHRARLLFLSEGNYMVSACLTSIEEILMILQLRKYVQAQVWSLPTHFLFGFSFVKMALIRCSFGPVQPLVNFESKKSKHAW